MDGMDGTSDPLLSTLSHHDDEEYGRNGIDGSKDYGRKDEEEYYYVYGGASLNHHGTSVFDNGSYATLTPLQPLPPISTVRGSERFSSVTTHASSTTDFGPSHSPFGSTSFTSSLLRSPKMEKVTFDEYGNYGDGEIGSSDVSPPSSSIVPSLSISQQIALALSPQRTSPDSSSADIEELNTKELALRISSELKRYSIPQAIFAQRVLCRSQGTLSDLLRNPKPWSKLKSGRETFRRMAKWLQEPELIRMSALRIAACKRKEDQTVIPNSNPAPKKPRLVFTDIQRRTLQAIFRETKRPSREMQLTISTQLNLDPTTVANFFMNARRRGHDRECREEYERNEGGTACSTVSSSESHFDSLFSSDIKMEDEVDLLHSSINLSSLNGKTRNLADALDEALLEEDDIDSHSLHLPDEVLKGDHDGLIVSVDEQAILEKVMNGHRREEAKMRRKEEEARDQLGEILQDELLVEDEPEDDDLLPPSTHFESLNPLVEGNDDHLDELIRGNLIEEPHQEAVQAL
uniref:One cut domain family member n=1 Tax=Pristionchus pacificus TaxID=54126 RepID=A0A2A6CC30_PRIPA|eukprot:PDM75657.1 ceh-48 [Pristionchus pacificus]